MNCAVVEKGIGGGMNPIPKQYANRPNLWRVACGLATYEEAYGVLDALMTILDAEMKETRA